MATSYVQDGGEDNGDRHTLAGMVATKTESPGGTTSLAKIDGMPWRRAAPVAAVGLCQPFPAALTTGITKRAGTPSGVEE